MRMLYKTIHFTEIAYHVLDSPGVMVAKSLTVPRKLPTKAAARLVRKAEGNALIAQTLTTRCYTQVYRMPFDRFVKNAERVESHEPITEERGPA